MNRIRQLNTDPNPHIKVKGSGNGLKITHKKFRFASGSQKEFRLYLLWLYSLQHWIFLYPS